MSDMREARGRSSSWAIAFWERRVPQNAKGFGTADIARITGSPQRTVQRWIQEGRLPALGSTEDSVFWARVPRAWLIEFLVRRMPMGFYPEQGDLPLE